METKYGKKVVKRKKGFCNMGNHDVAEGETLLVFGDGKGHGVCTRCVVQLRDLVKAGNGGQMGGMYGRE